MIVQYRHVSRSFVLRLLFTRKPEVPKGMVLGVYPVDAQIFNPHPQWWAAIWYHSRPA